MLTAMSKSIRSAIESLDAANAHVTESLSALQSPELRVEIAKAAREEVENAPAGWLDEIADMSCDIGYSDCTEINCGEGT